MLYYGSHAYIKYSVAVVVLREPSPAAFHPAGPTFNTQLSLDNVSIDILISMHIYPLYNLSHVFMHKLLCP